MSSAAYLPIEGSRLLSVGTDIHVDSPQELVEAIEIKAREIVHLSRPQTS
jgi:hypothetical protein